MSEPTTKASLASAALGCALLNKLVRELAEEQVDDIVDYDEAKRLDEAVWSMFEYAQTGRAAGIEGQSLL